MPSSLNLMTSLPHVVCGHWSLAEASLSLLHHQGWRLFKLSLRTRMCALCQYALTLVASGPRRLRMLSTRWKNTPFTTSQSKDRGRRTGFCWRLPGASWDRWRDTTGGNKQWCFHQRILELTSASSCARWRVTARSKTNSIFQTWPWAKQRHVTASVMEERYAEKLRASTAGGVYAGHATERHLFLGGSRPKGSVLVAPELDKWVASQLAEEAAILKERRKRT